ncbi:hypothetical protein [Myxococcus sp. AS-1-15]|uniref:hypothetical protein n=1 Tax=Myxococcus sp. AS-1-15 TaxID=2874600 RepID=UPI001CBB334E|nr:hypothetical protein [Myxococcus sp. AS-1-15]
MQRRTATGPVEERLQGVDTVALTRRKVEPMVRGLFPTSEQGAVLSLLEKSVVFLTPANISRVLRESSWLSTAWDMANLYHPVDHRPSARVRGRVPPPARAAGRAREATPVARTAPIHLDQLAAVLLRVAEKRAPLGAVLEGDSLWEEVAATGR